MEQAELDKLRAQLLAQRERLWAQLDYEQQVMRTSLRDSSGEHSMVDSGSDHAEREKTAQLTAAEQRLLESIEEALARIDRGQYGLCEDCGQPISPKRLLAVPDARRCLECQEKEDRTVQKGGA